MFESAKLYGMQVGAERRAYALLERATSVGARPARASVRTKPGAPRRGAACQQGCWGLANKAQYDACMEACFCGAYPHICNALRLSRSTRRGSGGPSHPIEFGGRG